MMPLGLVNRNNMQRADGVRNALLVNDHDELGMDGDVVPMRHADFFAARQFERERMKTVLQPAFDLLNNHGRNLVELP